MCLATPAVGALIFLGAVSVGAGQNAPPARRATSVLFAVSSHEQGGSRIEPIVLLKPRGGFLPPPSPSEENASSADISKFVKRYLSGGQTYRVLWNGVRAGTVRVTGPPGDPGIELSSPIHLSITSLVSLPLRFPVMALATDDARLGGATGKRSGRRAATAGEKEMALELARQIVRKNRAPKAAIDRLKLLSLTVLQDDGSGHPALIGSFAATISNRSGDEYSLFLVAAPNAEKTGGWVPRLALYHKGTESEVQQPYLVDAVDLDHDGLLELVTQTFYYESHDFAIYARKKGQPWRRAYQGGGGGV